jgi:hypothetical protein
LVTDPSQLPEQLDEENKKEQKQKKISGSPAKKRGKMRNKGEIFEERSTFNKRPIYEPRRDHQGGYKPRNYGFPESYEKIDSSSAVASVEPSGRGSPASASASSFFLPISASLQAVRSTAPLTHSTSDAGYLMRREAKQNAQCDADASVVVLPPLMKPWDFQTVPEMASPDKVKARKNFVPKLGRHQTGARHQKRVSESLLSPIEISSSRKPCGKHTPIWGEALQLGTSIMGGNSKSRYYSMEEMRRGLRAKSGAAKR